MTQSGAARDIFRREAARVARVARAEIDAATARMRALEAQHVCALKGCERFGAWGFGPPSYGEQRWACSEHREAVAAGRVG